MVASILEILKLGTFKLLVIFSFYLCFLITLGWCNESIQLADLMTSKGVEIIVLSFLTFSFLGIIFPVISVIILRAICKRYAEKELTPQNYKDNHFFIVNAILWMLKTFDIDRDEFASDMIFVMNDFCRYGIIGTAIALQISILSGKSWIWLLFIVLLSFTVACFVTDYFLKRIQLLNELNRDNRKIPN